MRWLALLGLLLIWATSATADSHSSVTSERSARSIDDVKQIVFAVRKPGDDGHWYANFAYYAESTERKTYRPGGRLCALDMETGKVRVLVDDPQGGVRDPAVHYDGRTIVFSYRKGESDHYHLYTIQSDGTNLKQLTDGNYDDIEPCWLPDGGIAFVSSRCKRWVQCWLTQVAVLYRCNADGSNITQLSSNVEHDNTPWVLPDGRILYQRWEYVDRSQVHFHHLWTMNPDGTGVMVYFGNQQGGTVMIDAKPIPDTDKVVAIFSPGHGQREHAGVVTIVDPDSGPDHQPSAKRVHPDGAMRDPYALSEDQFIAARNHEMLLLGRDGSLKQLHTLSEEDRKAGFHLPEPRPLIERQRETIIAPRTAPQQTTGRLVLADIYEGRNMGGIARGEIRKLLVLETLPKPINYTGGMDPLSYGGTFTVERIL
ncbi:MAG: hypothetical protein MI741_23715, partial [Rhodospirillales bacterium]|nr:hypothetical protein [Rhodospirillales bacterium]